MNELRESHSYYLVTRHVLQYANLWSEPEYSGRVYLNNAWVRTYRRKQLFEDEWTHKQAQPVQRCEISHRWYILRLLYSDAAHVDIAEY